MPNRYVREDAIESERVNALSWQGEVFYRRLINRVDDFGCYPAHLEILRARIFPLQLAKVSSTEIEKLLLECEQAALLSRWTDEASGKAYLVLHKWEPGRAKERKYPKPPVSICERLQASANGCAHPQARAPDSDPAPDSDSGLYPPQRAGDIQTTSPERGLPTLETVSAWAAMDGVDPALAELFFNHYESVGWIDGGGNAILKPRYRLKKWASEARAKGEADKRNGASGGNGNFWKSKARLEMVENEIKSIRARASESAGGGFTVQIKDKPLWDKLKGERSDIKKELGLL